MVGIVNYGMGNLASVKNSFDHLNIKSEIINKPKDLENVDKILLPGVGAFGMAMQNLNKFGFANVLKELVIIKKKPILGICLGMQLLLSSSTEYGFHEGLNLIEGQVVYFNDYVNDLIVPHMGWNDVNYKPESNLFRNLTQDPTFYFVHSYYCKVADKNKVAGVTNYGVDFDSAIESDNVFGCQFHPEKSHENGLTVFKNFGVA